MGCHLSGVLCLERRGDLWRRRWWEKGHLLTYQASAGRSADMQVRRVRREHKDVFGITCYAVFVFIQH